MPSFDSDALAGLDEWLGQIMAGLAPSQRRKASLKLGQALRRANLARIAANVQPDGTPMEPRKPRKDRRGRLKRKQGGRMFYQLRAARRWKIDAQPDSVELAPKVGEVVAAIHHFGLSGTVGKDHEGKPIKYRYPARRLLGFGPGDEQLALDIAAGLISPSSR